MKKLKLFLSLAILVFTTSATFAQQTKKSEALGNKSERVSRKQTKKVKPEAVKEMQEEQGIGQGKPEWIKKKKTEKDAVKKNRKSRKGKKGKKGKMKKRGKNKKGTLKKRRPNKQTTKPHIDGRSEIMENTVPLPKIKKERSSVKSPAPERVSKQTSQQ